MRIKTALIAGLGLMAIGATQAVAEAKIYPYHSSHNFCPAGLQPVSINGTVCCGTPNQNMSYQQALAHPVAKKKHKVRKVRHHKRKVHRTHCPVGTKGCTFD